MAEAVAAWPVEATRVPDSTDVVAETGAPAADAAAPPTPLDEERELWRTAEVRLAVRRDARTARDVLIEERVQPLEDAALARLRSIAAAGGPFVQRVLRLSEDRRAIWYEAITGETMPLDELPARNAAARRRAGIAARGRGAPRRAHRRGSGRPGRARAAAR